MGKKGYVFLWRRAKESDIYRDILAWRVFESLFMDAKYMACTIKAGGKTIRLKRGQVLIGLRKYAKELNISLGQIRAALGRLENKYSAIETTTQLTTHFTTHPGTLVTILKYRSYQTPKTGNNTVYNTLYDTQVLKKYKTSKKKTCREPTILRHKGPELAGKTLQEIFDISKRESYMVKCQYCGVQFNLWNGRKCPACGAEYPRSAEEEQEFVKAKLNSSGYKWPWMVDNDEEKEG